MMQIEELKVIIFGEIVANEGMIQSEYVKNFPEDLQELVGVAIRILADKGYITREKAGRSYKLYIAECHK